MRHLLLSVWALIFLPLFSPVFAVSVPSFPLCASPQGDVQVSYSEGVHGIVGSTASYTGKDTVYRLSETQVTQCFCAADGQGIQTNWWEASALLDEDVRILETQGWMYVPTGSVWGLSDKPYMAKNISYSCLPGQNGGGSSSTTSNGTGGGGDIAGESTGDILGLAATGDTVLLIGIFLSAFLTLAFSISRILRGARSEKNN